MNIPKCACLTLLATTLAISAVSHGDEHEPAILLSVDCMRSTAGDYVNVETEIWQPMHQKMVDDGQILGWALYWVRFGDRSDCDYYTVTTYEGADQLNAAPDFIGIFTEVHPDKDVDEAMKRTMSSRQHKATNLWYMIDSVNAGAHPIAIVNTMHSKTPEDYIELEREVYKPVHEAHVEGGHLAGWGLYSLVYPGGSSVPYNFSTVDFRDKLGPLPTMETMEAVHPDKDLDELWEATMDVRTRFESETWVRIAATELRETD